MAAHTQPAPADLHSSTPPNYSGATFLVVYCDACERDVLGARDLDGDGLLVDVCMHCDQPVDRHDASARWVGAAELTERGYFVDGFEQVDDRHGGGGCRGGSCGVQQPDKRS